MTHDAPTVDPDVIVERRVLVVIGGGAVVERELPPPQARARLVIGRALECDVRIDDPAISRTHVVLVVEERMLLLVESRTGKTLVDGREVPAGAKVVLEPGQLVEVGKSRLVVRRDRRLAAGPRTGSRPMDATRRAIDIAAKSDLPVLLLGETGAGKEVAMEQIVRGGRRSAGPLVRIDCAALPSSMLESELLGHEKGAASGAARAKPGLFETANGGTAFLDEIANVPFEMQSKLLGVIEGRAVTRVGGVTARPVDVRVIAATNVDVRARVAEGTFREDLYFRLAGVVISVPPLRERQDEIADLARTLLAAEAAREKLPVPALTEGAVALLVAYRWPGNVRELRNVLGRAMHVARGRAIDVGDLELVPPAKREEPEAREEGAEREGDSKSTGEVATASKAASASGGEKPGTPEYERARIVKAMERAQGNQKEAARLLGMTRRMLMYRLDTYGLPRPRKR